MTTWLQHVKKVHAAGSTSFKESLKRASASWKKQKGSSAAKPKKKRGKKKSAAAEASTEEPEEAAPAPKKKRRRKAKRSMPKLPDEVYKSVDNRAV